MSQVHDGSAAIAARLDAHMRPDIGSESIVELAHVRKLYRGRGHVLVEAVADVSLAINRGEFVSLLGPSGCGKSTILMLVSGLLPISDGSITIGGHTVDGPQTDIGIVFQNDVLLNWRTALQNVMLQVEARRLETRAYRERALELLHSTGLGDFAHALPWQLSGGMRQRVSICRALIHDPPLLLMDEPFGALDALTREQMAVELQKLWQRSQKTILFVTHSIQEAVFLSSRVVVMTPRPGQIEAVINIDLPRPRRLKIMGDPKFASYVQQITELFMSRGVISEEDYA